MYWKAPTAYPKNLTITQVTPTYVMFQWTKLSEVDENLPILGYQYIISTSTGVFSGKTPCDKTYDSILIPEGDQKILSIAVAGINLAGVGKYSPPVEISIISKENVVAESEAEEEIEVESSPDRETDATWEADVTDAAESEQMEKESSSSKSYQSKFLQMTI